MHIGLPITASQQVNSSLPLTKISTTTPSGQVQTRKLIGQWFRQFFMASCYTILTGIIATVSCAIVFAALGIVIPVIGNCLFLVALALLFAALGVVNYFVFDRIVIEPRPMQKNLETFIENLVLPPQDELNQNAKNVCSYLGIKNSDDLKQMCHSLATHRFIQGYEGNCFIISHFIRWQSENKGLETIIKLFCQLVTKGEAKLMVGGTQKTFPAFCLKGKISFNKTPHGFLCDNMAEWYATGDTEQWSIGCQYSHLRDFVESINMKPSNDPLNQALQSLISSHYGDISKLRSAISDEFGKNSQYHWDGKKYKRVPPVKDSLINLHFSRKLINKFGASCQEKGICNKNFEDFGGTKMRWRHIFIQNYSGDARYEINSFTPYNLLIALFNMKKHFGLADGTLVPFGIDGHICNAVIPIGYNSMDDLPYRCIIPVGTSNWRPFWRRQLGILKIGSHMCFISELGIPIPGRLITKEFSLHDPAQFVLQIVD